MSRSDRILDRVLQGRAPADETTAPLAEMARRLEGAFDIEAPDTGREGAMFAAAVGARHRVTPWRYLGPVVAVTSLLSAVFFAGRVAAPGDVLYPVRRVLQEVDLAPSLSDRVAHGLALAQAELAEADRVLVERPRRAQILAGDVLKALGAIEELLRELPDDERAVFELAVDELEDEARVTSITAASIIAGRQPGEPQDDRSGPGGGSGGDDSSGSEPGDDSGPGSDDSGSVDSDSDDDSEPGSDDSGPDGDSEPDGDSRSGDDSEADEDHEPDDEVEVDEDSDDAGSDDPEVDD